VSKTRPIGNLLKHCEKVEEGFDDLPDSMHKKDYDRMLCNKGWIQATKFIIKYYDCSPKDERN